jgi:hypothetical protein
MKINLRIDFLDGTSKEVSCIAADLVKFETKFDISVVELEKKTRFSHLLFLAWCAESRTKSTGLDFDGWIETVSMINPSEIDPK